MLKHDSRMNFGHRDILNILLASAGSKSIRSEQLKNSEMGSISFSLRINFDFFTIMWPEGVIQYIIIAARFNASVRFGHTYWSTPRGRA